MMCFFNRFFVLAYLLFTVCCVGKNDSKTVETPNDTIIENALDSIPGMIKYTSGIRCILHDSKGNYWFGSDREGVCKFNGKTFTYFTEAEGLAAKQVIDIVEDEYGTIWIAATGGLYSYDGKRLRAIDIHNDAYATWQLTPTDLWFANGFDILRVDKNKLYNLENKLPLMHGQNKRDLGATGFSKGADGSIWIGCYDGVIGYNGKSFTFINDSTQQYDGKQNYMHVRSILADSKNRVWVGNNSIGVLLKEGDSIVNFSEQMGLRKGAIFNTKSPPGTLMHVFAIREDKQGNIWFGDRDTGVWRYDGKEIKKIPVNASLDGLHVWDIYEDRYGTILIGMGAGGVYKFNGQSFDRIL